MTSSFLTRWGGRVSVALAGVALASLGMASAQPVASTGMLRQPAISKDHLAFVYAGDIWLAERSGANPRRLTSHAASEFAPHFSPDGQRIAFSASYDGNTDVYVMSIDGGQPKRLTWHPAADVVTGWSADGQRVLFASPREVLNSRSRQLFEVNVDAAAGAYEKKVMEAVAYEGAWAADGKRLAYRPYGKADAGASGWRLHRGGSTPPIWIIEPATGKWQAVPHVNASDWGPVWAQDEVVFISDRNDGAANLFAFNPSTQALRQLTRETQWDVKNVDAFGTSLVYEVGGQLKEIDLAGATPGTPRLLPIRLNPASVQARPQWKDASQAVTSARLSATGQRVLVSARGEIFNVPVKDGSVRNLTQSGGVREKDGLWSPDGLRVAYLSDAPRMRHQLVLRGQSGLDKPDVIELPAQGYFNLLAWSPDARTLVLQDNHLNLYKLSLIAGPKRISLDRIATSLRRSGGGFGGFDVAFSPDSRWLAYTTVLANHFGQVRVHDLQTGSHHVVSDGLSHAQSPVFSRAGDLLFFTASINSGPTQVGLDMSTQERPLRAGVFAAVLAADGKSPLLPRAGDEASAKVDADKPDDKKGDDKKPEAKPAKAGVKPDAKADAKADDKAPKPVRIDFEGLAQRIVALPLPERNYTSLAAAADGALFYLEQRQPGASIDGTESDEGRSPAQLMRFDFTERKAKMLKAGVEDFSLSADGKKLLLQVGTGKFEVADANDKPEGKPVDLSGLRMKVDPRAEWRQIFDETWWLEREFFYDPALHGLDWQAVYDRYLPRLADVQRREDLNELLVEMIAELQVGHNRLGGGDVHHETPAPVGVLGADFAFSQGAMQIKKIYRGDRWNPFLKAPLAVPGLGVKEGDFILAVNGRALDAQLNLFALLENTVGKQVALSVASDAAGANRREVIVEPIANEGALRQWAWIERNRQTVEAKSGGRVAYVYLPDTADQGFQHFNRMFFAQVDKQALIVDDRKNNGGQAANYVTELLSRPYLSSWKDRDGLVYDTPGGAIYGPKAMLIDQDAGSGGDFLPYAFKRVGLGPLIGKRTWGGLIGIAINPPLIDGGFLTVPFFRFYTPEGEWRVENEGVAPDIEVELDPAAVNRGEDSQLDAAIANVLKRLADWQPVQRQTAPAMPGLGR